MGLFDSLLNAGKKALNDAATKEIADKLDDTLGSVMKGISSAASGLDSDTFGKEANSYNKPNASYDSRIGDNNVSVASTASRGKIDRRSFDEKLKAEGKDIEKASDKEVIDAILSFVQMIDKQYEGKKMAEDFKDYSYEKYMKYSSAQFDELLKDLTNKKDCPKDFVEKFSKSLYKVVISGTHIYLPKSQLIFWGYGENELFPSYHAYSVSLAIDGRLKLTYDTGLKVSETKGSCVAPFAQTDVANTVVRGVDDTLRQQFYTQFNDSVSMIKEELLKGLEAAGAPDELKKVVSGIDVSKYQGLYKKSMDDYIDANYVNKLLDMVSSLGKEDLGDMAENLVRMTCLKRHITTDEETVGGPVDVAVITKGDGFVWLKRKHYFSADINHRYFERN